MFIIMSSLNLFTLIFHVILFVHEQGIWAGMISGTVIQTLILIIITMRCEWEEEVKVVDIGVLCNTIYTLIFLGS